MQLSEEFLNQKIQRSVEFFSLENELHIVHGTDLKCNGPILYMIVWNLLGCFNGHYECLVNLDTFEYQVKQHSCYGGLTWTTPAEDSTVYTKEMLTEEQQIKIEAHIAKTIRMVYYPSICNNPLPVMDESTQRLVYGSVRPCGL